MSSATGAGAGSDDDAADGQQQTTYLDFIFNVDQSRSSDDEDFVPPIVFSSDDDDEEYRSDEFSDEDMGPPRVEGGLPAPAAAPDDGDIVSNRTRAKYARVRERIGNMEEFVRQVPEEKAAMDNQRAEMEQASKDYHRLVSALASGDMEGKDLDDGEEDDDEYIPEEDDDSGDEEEEHESSRLAYLEVQELHIDHKLHSRGRPQAPLQPRHPRTQQAALNANLENSGRDATSIVDIIGGSKRSSVHASRRITQDQVRTLRRQLEKHAMMLIVQQQLVRSAHCHTPISNNQAHDVATPFPGVYRGTTELLLELFHRQEEVKCVLYVHVCVHASIWMLRS
jgi:hypothetical protein